MTEAAIRICSLKWVLLEFLFNEVAGLKTCSFIKKRLQHRCFPVNIAKCLKTVFYRTPLMAASIVNLLRKDFYM